MRMLSMTYFDILNYVLFGENYGTPSATITVENINDMPNIENVIFNDPATIVFWDDGTKTIVKCQKETGDTFSKENGLAMAIAKRAYGNKGNFNDIFKKWIGDK